ncbi:MAG: PorT family protein [Muribaculaceae bacterium]|nr:PorT family protein [Muribaculaceae bacterium]
MLNRLRISLIALTLAASASVASAQTKWWDSTRSTEGITLTGNFGLNISDFRGGDSWSGAKAGINIGVMAEKPIFTSLSVKAGLFYTMKGNHHKSDGAFGGTLEVTYNPGYIELPIMASYRYQLNTDIRLQFDFGPYFAVGVHGKDIKKHGGGATHDSKIEYNLFGKDGQWSRFDFGFRFGPEVIWKDRFSAGLAYEVSAVNIWPDSGGNLGNSNFMINLGYKFYTS